MSGVQLLASAGLATLLALPVPLGAGLPGPRLPPAPVARARLAITDATVDLTLRASTRSLQGLARLRLAPGAAGLAELALHPALTPTRVRLGERPLAWRREGARLLIGLPVGFTGGVLEVAWHGRPQLRGPAGVRQDVEPRVALLRPDGAWWPCPPGATPPIALTVRLPEGWRAIAVNPHAEFHRTGRVAGLKAATLEAVGLVAGPFSPVVRAGLRGWGPARGQGEADRPLPALLRAHGLAPSPGLRWVELPPGFAPVACAGLSAAPPAPGPEGAQAAALAFAPQGAAGADAPDRPWLVEALAAYLARASVRGGAPDALQRHLASEYQAYLASREGPDVPIRAALAAEGPRREAVLGLKGGLAWALVRAALGEEAFWALLRAWQRELQAGRGDMAAFLALAPRPLSWLSAWLEEPGLPAISFEALCVEQHAGRWRVTGALTHRAGLLGVPTELALITADGVERVPFRTFAPRMPFTFVTRSRPLRLVLDAAGQAPLVRRTHLRIREAAAQPDAIVVPGSQGDAALNEAMRQAADQLARRLPGPGKPPLAVRLDSELTAEERAGPLILVGRPGAHLLATEWADQLPVRFSAAPAGGTTGRVLWWQGRTWARPEVGVVAAIANPLAPERQVLLVAGLSPQAQREALQHVHRGATFCIFDARGPAEEGQALRPFPDLEAPLY
ncbi:MAG: hypothetical protein VKQ33_06095 [Candidatus Sericytochromatia bacterium]|nr:hypothetical protein [Candidatus Sericytochromatia bacterium]